MNRKIIGDILVLVCNEFQISKQDLLSSSRERKFVIPRQIAMYLLRQQGLSLQTIANALNRKDHTTIRHALMKNDIKEQAEKIGIPLATDIHDTQILYPAKTKYHHKYQWLFDLIEPKCQICGFDDVIEIHHVVSPKKGGDENFDNLVILCPNHHALLHAGLLKINHLSTSHPELSTKLLT